MRMQRLRRPTARLPLLGRIVLYALIAILALDLVALMLVWAWIGAQS